MLAYAANRPLAGKRQSSPHAMLLIISAHVALVAAVMSARMDLPQKIKHAPTLIDFIAAPAPEPAPRPQPATEPQTALTIVRDPVADLPPPLPRADHPPLDQAPALDPGSLAGAGTAVLPEIPKPTVTAVHRDARLLTPAADLKPPYPSSKLLSGEEAVLTLRLSIDERGRVVAVEPVGRADRAFLEAARRHLLAHWRYQPATDDGRAVATTVTVTLHFMLDG
jgi:protein TonB